MKNYWIKRRIEKEINQVAQAIKNRWVGLELTQNNWAGPGVAQIMVKVSQTGHVIGAVKRQRNGEWSYLWSIFSVGTALKNGSTVPTFLATKTMISGKYNFSDPAFLAGMESVFDKSIASWKVKMEELKECKKILSS
jgi:hypothetical protein